MTEKRKRILNDNFLKKKHLKSNTISKVDSKLMAIPHGVLCGSQQLRKIDFFKLTSQTLPCSLLIVVRRIMVQKDCLLTRKFVMY